MPNVGKTFCDIPPLHKHTVFSNDSIGNMAHSPQPPPMSDTGIRVNSISNTGILIHPVRVPVTSNLGILLHQGQVCIKWGYLRGNRR